MEQTLNIGIGELAVAKSPTVLETLSLGSCVGVMLYDVAARVGGLAHIMLPDSTLSKIPGKPTKFADTAVVMMIDEMVRQGADRNRLTARIAGGAKMFDMMTLESVGERNVKAVRDVLQRQRIPILNEDTGRNYGRTVRLYTETGRIEVKSMKYGTREM